MTTKSIDGGIEQVEDDEYGWAISGISRLFDLDHPTYFSFAGSHSGGVHSGIRSTWTLPFLWYSTHRSSGSSPSPLRVSTASG